MKIPLQSSIALIIVVIVLIVVYVNYNMHGDLYENFMYGYWVADEEFCADAEVSSMLLMIGKPTSTSIMGWQTRPAHLVINNDITNQSIVIGHYKPSSGIDRGVDKFTLDANIEFEEDCGMPNDMSMEFDVRRGMLRMFAGEKIYAVFYKDMQVTDVLDANGDFADMNSEPIESS